MKKISILIFALLAATLAFAQVEPIEPSERKEETNPEEKDTDYFFEESEEQERKREEREARKRDKNRIKTLAGQNRHNGGFGALSFRGTSIRGKTAVFGGFRAGWIINRSLAIGFEGHGLIPTAKYDGIDPDYRAVLLGGYGGLFLEPIFFSNEVVHITFPISAGAGWFGYHKDWDQYYDYNGSLIAGDVFWYVEPGASAELNISRNFRIGIGVSKRFTQDLVLPDTPSGEFENINYFLTLKFGTF